MSGADPFGRPLGTASGEAFDEKADLVQLRSHRTFFNVRHILILIAFFSAVGFALGTLAMMVASS